MRTFLSLHLFCTSEAIMHEATLLLVRLSSACRQTDKRTKHKKELHYLMGYKLRCATRGGWDGWRQCGLQCQLILKMILTSNHREEKKEKEICVSRRPQSMCCWVWCSMKQLQEGQNQIKLNIKNSSRQPHSKPFPLARLLTFIQAMNFAAAPLTCWRITTGQYYSSQPCIKKEWLWGKYYNRLHWDQKWREDASKYDNSPLKKNRQL